MTNATKVKSARTLVVILLLIAALLASAAYIYRQRTAIKTKDAAVSFQDRLRATVSPRGTHDGNLPDDKNMTGDSSAQDIYNFDYNIHNDVIAQQKKELDALINLLVTNKQKVVKIIVRGYADNVGSDKYNQDLSEKRCSHIESLLMGSGIAMEKEGKGKKNPVATNSTPEGQAKNRRVEVTIRYKKDL
jgi:outer membrane protein OmpA-like peptidoglycan-associated protein